ncbi:MAG: BrnT family toxin [Azoarcus sp.]|nr:BrnT family toxin [Azoarcus sp.]
MIEFEWDSKKAALNLKKHGVAFEEAAQIFCDSCRIETYDGRENYGEDRFATVGLVRSAVLHVLYTVRGKERIRLISARKATSDEKNRYGQANA